MINMEPGTMIVVAVLIAIALIVAIAFRRDLSKLWNRDRSDSKEVASGGRVIPATRVPAASTSQAVSGGVPASTQNPQLSAELDTLRLEIKELTQAIGALRVEIQKSRAESEKGARTPPPRAAAAAAGQGGAIELPSSGITQLVVNINTGGKTGPAAVRSLLDRVLDAFNDSESPTSALQNLGAERVLVINMKEAREGLAEPEFRGRSDGDLLLIKESEFEGWLVPRPGPVTEIVYTGIQSSFHLENYQDGCKYRASRLIRPAKVVRHGDRWLIAADGQGRLELIGPQASRA